MSSTIDVCIVGAGFHATTNIYPSAIEAGLNIISICTRSINKSFATLNRFDCTDGRPYADCDVMLNAENCRNVLVVAQPCDQKDLVLHCIRSSRNVYVDKPLGMNASEARLVARAAKDAGVFVMVGFMKRYAPIYQQLHEIICSKSHGDVKSFETRFACDSTPFCKTEREFVMFVAIHFLDLIRFLFGEVTDISGFHNIDGPNICQSLSLKCASGATGSVTFLGMTAYSSESEHINVTFANGYATAHELKTLTVHKNSPVPSICTESKDKDRPWKYMAEANTVYSHAVSTMSGSYGDFYQRGFVGEMAHFKHCCETGSQPISNADDNVLTMELCDRVLKILNP